jgi:hypothetical protein
VKIISTLFLLVALIGMLYVNIAQIGGVYMNLNEAKQEASIRLNRENLSTITISETDLISGKASYINEKEIRYDGNLYDIGSSSTQDGNITLKVLHDEKEEGVLSNLKDIVDGWLNTTKNTNQHSLKQIVMIKDFIPVHQFAFNISTTFVEVSAISYSFPTESALLAVLKSPPKFV